MKTIFMVVAVLGFASSAWAHDGVALEKDSCTLKAGPYRQPRTNELHDHRRHGKFSQPT